MPAYNPDPMLIALLDAAEVHVPFDGWSQTTFDAAVAEVGMNPAHAKTLCPRGAADLAVAYHLRGDARMVAALDADDLDEMRFRDRVAHAIRVRLADADKEIVRRGSALFALPHMAADGAKLIWGTADAVWTALGDTSNDVNWYTKRATLSAVYGSVVLFWLGDDGTGLDDFIDRRIDNVMQFEKVKAQVNKNPLLKPLTGPLARMASMIKAPARIPDVDLPGVWHDPK
ncbi:MAG: COQ9 family protein [Yoonia sp.]|jgi:ubiquinone biosynthesis protein COQ9|nr:COQ9 family protein [Yoonia sp.]MDG1520630.1 COQ9 family protein [Yoonia sp.]MDG1768088.1 COQ9 family protein [Yoonia sp.]